MTEAPIPAPESDNPNELALSDDIKNLFDAVDTTVTAGPGYIPSPIGKVVLLAPPEAHLAFLVIRFNKRHMQGSNWDATDLETEKDMPSDPLIPVAGLALIKPESKRRIMNINLWRILQVNDLFVAESSVALVDPKRFEAQKTSLLESIMIQRELGITQVTKGECKEKQKMVTEARPLLR